jgi:hypothetical protein
MLMNIVFLNSEAGIGLDRAFQYSGRGIELTEVRL